MEESERKRKTVVIFCAKDLATQLFLILILYLSSCLLSTRSDDTCVNLSDL